MKKLLAGAVLLGSVVSILDCRPAVAQSTVCILDARPVCHGSAVNILDARADDYHTHPVR